mmetsp:Transcript_5399/g.5618  ORF Transcript_5399/g.5618 Transcript_5399/m.5618 type:complete len:94 (+) Transcript_5399:96-377(+)
MGGGCAINNKKLAEDILSTETTNRALINDFLSPSEPEKIEPQNIYHAGNNDLPRDKSANVKITEIEKSVNEGCSVKDEKLAQPMLSTELQTQH